MINWITELVIPKPFASITYQGATVIDRVHCIPNYFIDSDDPESYKVKLVWMTERKYKQLPEFVGF